MSDDTRPDGADETLGSAPAREPRTDARGATSPSPAAGAAPELTGSFGRYRIERRLGAGAMGAVYLAHDTQLDRRVALKIPKLTPEDGPEVLERFLREARAAAGLHHPNLCPVYDAGVCEGQHFMTTAFVDGLPLVERLRQGPPVAIGEAVALVRRMAVALGVAHARGVIHRDLKPGNVMMDGAEPVIVDFGLARITVADAERLTRSGAVMGTPAYMSPEQVDGDVARMGPGCDVYSLGVMLYELLSGRLPFTGSVASVLGQIMSREPASPRAINPAVPARLEAICLRAMAKRPEDRWGSMTDFAQALAAWEAAPDAAGAASPSDAMTATVRPQAAQGVRPAAARGARGALALGIGVALLAAVYALRAPPPSVGPGAALPPLPPAPPPAVGPGPALPQLPPAPPMPPVGIVPAPPPYPPGKATLPFGGRPPPMPGGPADVEGLVRQVAGGGEDAPLDQLRSVAPERVGGALASALESAVPAVRRWAAFKLTELQVADALSAVERHLVDDGAFGSIRDDKEPALGFLQVMASDHVVPALLRVFRSHDPQLRAWAAQSLAATQDRACVPELEARLKAREPYAGLAADRDPPLAALAVLAPERVRPVLTELSKESRPEIRDWAARELALRAK